MITATLLLVVEAYGAGNQPVPIGAVNDNLATHAALKPRAPVWEISAAISQANNSIAVTSNTAADCANAALTFLQAMGGTYSINSTPVHSGHVWQGDRWTDDPDPPNPPSWGYAFEILQSDGANGWSGISQTLTVVDGTTERVIVIRHLLVVQAP